MSASLRNPRESGVRKARRAGALTEGVASTTACEAGIVHGQRVSVGRVGMAIDNHSSDGPGDVVALPATAPACDARALPRKGRLLVVDDEPQIGNTLRLLLDPDHEVVPVTNARDAFVKIANAGPFDIIFCDLMMPEVSGIEFYRTLVETAPELRDRLVFMTGGVFSQKTNDFLDTVPNTCIEKPFDIAALMRLIRDRVGSA